MRLSDFASKGEPIMAVKSDQFPYKKLLFIGAFLQLILGVVLYMTQTVAPTLLYAFGAVSLICLILGAKWHSKFSRVLVRFFAWSAPGMMLILSLLITLFLDISNLWPSRWGLLLIQLTGFVQTALLIFIPALAVLAHTQQKRMDIFVLRLYTIAEVILSIITVALVESNDYLSVTFDNIYYNLFFAAICVLTALCALVAFPIKTSWLNNLLNQSVSKMKHTDENEE